jgi:hypothetical protein
MRSKVSLRRALEDSSLLGAVLGGDSWRNWRTILIAANGEELTQDELEIYRKFTGGRPVLPRSASTNFGVQSEDAVASRERWRQRPSITTLSANITWPEVRGRAFCLSRRTKPPPKYRPIMSKALWTQLPCFAN